MRPSAHAFAVLSTLTLTLVGCASPTEDATGEDGARFTASADAVPSLDDVQMPDTTPKPYYSGYLTDTYVLFAAGHGAWLDKVERLPTPYTNYYYWTEAAADGPRGFGFAGRNKTLGQPFVVHWGRSGEAQPRVGTYECGAGEAAVAMTETSSTEKVVFPGASACKVVIDMVTEPREWKAAHTYRISGRFAVAANPPSFPQAVRGVFEIDATSQAERLADHR